MDLEENRRTRLLAFANTLLAALVGIVLAEFGVTQIYHLWWALIPVWATDEFTALVIHMFVMFIIRPTVAIVVTVVTALGISYLAQRTQRTRSPFIVVSVILSAFGSMAWAFYQIAKDVYAP